MSVTELIKKLIYIIIGKPKDILIKVNRAEALLELIKISIKELFMSKLIYIILLISIPDNIRIIIDLDNIRSLNLILILSPIYSFY